jgi:hypothetical protein
MYILISLKNISQLSQLGLLFPIYGKKKKCSKPPTRSNQYIEFLGRRSQRNWRCISSESWGLKNPTLAVSKWFDPNQQGSYTYPTGLTSGPPRPPTKESRSCFLLCWDLKTEETGFLSPKICRACPADVPGPDDTSGSSQGSSLIWDLGSSPRNRGENHHQLTDQKKITIT